MIVDISISCRELAGSWEVDYLPIYEDSLQKLIMFPTGVSMNSILLLGNSSFTTGLRSQVRGLASLTVTTATTTDEATTLIESLSPDIVIAQAHMLREASVVQTFGQPQSAYVIVIETELAVPNSEESSAALQLDKTAHALESGADAYLWLPTSSSKEAKKDNDKIALELAPVSAKRTHRSRTGNQSEYQTLHKQEQLTADSRDFTDRCAPKDTSENTSPTAEPAFILQADQCRLIQAHIQIGLSRAQRYRDLSRINDWLSAVALVDALTQLNNRRAFDLELPNQIKMARQKKTPLCLMVLDIDYFKSVNDRYGHLVGDDVLKQLAKRLLANMRFYDTPFRYGGEEFVITLNNTDAAEGITIANRLRQIIATPPFTLTQPVKDLKALEITVSIGLTELKAQDDGQGRSFIDRADKGLLHAKESGRNQVVVN